MNAADTAWMLISTALVLMMTPALGFFYAGMVRAKNALNTLMMVEHALEMLAAKHVVELDDERRAAMVSNLLVVLCSDRHTQPVVNTGTLYS